MGCIVFKKRLQNGLRVLGVSRMKYPERTCPNCNKKYDWWDLEFCQKACWEAYEQKKEASQ
jgi:hypothetical protein